MRFSDIEIGVNQPATGQPVISDLTPREGLQLTVNTAAIADANGLGAFGYQWQQSIDGGTWGKIAGATAATFTPDDNAGPVSSEKRRVRKGGVSTFSSRWLPYHLKKKKLKRSHSN